MKQQAANDAHGIAYILNYIILKVPLFT
jgi:hypothetical protein